MWNVRNIEFRPVELDFRSSGGQGRHSTTAVFADGVELINALPLLDLCSDPVQVIVCGHCGIVNCKPGDWVCLRRLGHGLVVIPSFPDVSERSDPEYGPPDCINRKGAAFISGDALRALGTGAVAFRELDRWPWLTASEFSRIMQWEAPTRILGEFPAPPRLQREFVVALDPGQQEETMTVFDDLLARAFASTEPVTPVRGDPVSFFLDLPGFVEWVPLAFDSGTALLANGPDWIVSFPHDA
jgi:hypothetical protein